MKCRVGSDNLSKHLYTLPWSFEQLHTSMLATDDTTSVCPNVRHLTVDVPCTNLSHRFPNVHTLTIIHECDLSQDNHIGFRRLRHLTMRNINIVPSSLIQHTHTMTLFETNELLNNPVIYSNIQHLILKYCKIDSSATAIGLVKHFPNLQWLEIRLQSNAEYYDSLDILLSGEYLPYLLLLKTNWMNTEPYCSDIDLWIAAKTSLKWSSTPFYGYRHDTDLIICL